MSVRQTYLLYGMLPVRSTYKTKDLTLCKSIVVIVTRWRGLSKFNVRRSASIGLNVLDTVCVRYVGHCPLKKCFVTVLP